jgi:hypothetical protein
MNTLLCTEKAIGWILPNGQFTEVDVMGHLSFARSEVKDVFGIEPVDPENTLLHNGYVKVGSDGYKRYATTYGVIKARQWQAIFGLGIDEKRVIERK